jgi:tRNA-splicing endonuclease subunit Sen2
MKFGGEFLLYQKGPHVNHASYIVHIQDDSPMDNHNLQSMIRISETTAKHLLILEIHYPEDFDKESVNSLECLERLHEFKICEVVPKRFNVSTDRQKFMPKASTSRRNKKR